MGTRSFVGMMNGDVCTAVYVHYDGYLEGVGRGLQSYKTQAEVEELISHGDRSSLNGYYYKDRGETGVEPMYYDTFDEFFTACVGSWCEWYYIFKDGVWYCGNNYERSALYKRLTPYAEAVEMYHSESA
jgi:hypothetical protein